MVGVPVVGGSLSPPNLRIFRESEPLPLLGVISLVPFPAAVHACVSKDFDW